MKKIELEISGISASDAKQGTYALILSEKSSSRRLPIVIGLFEAQIIAIEMENMKPSRPLTHDLFFELADTCNIKLLEVRIVRLVDGIFYAYIHGKKPDGHTFEVDARPSDAVALALKFNLPIFTIPAVMEQAGIDVKDYLSEEEEKESPVKKNQNIKDITHSLHELSNEILDIALEDAVKLENYEVAASIRDEIKRRKNAENKRKDNSNNTNKD